VPGVLVVGVVGIGVVVVVILVLGAVGVVVVGVVRVVVVSVCVLLSVVVVLGEAFVAAWASGAALIPAIHNVGAAVIATVLAKTASRRFPRVRAQRNPDWRPICDQSRGPA
jgi:hypothetical protein